MNEILFTVIEGIIALSILIIMRYVIPYLKYKVLAEIDKTVWEMVVKEVKSVEQSITGNGKGAEKKREVMQRIYVWAEKHNIQITPEQISQLIETAVYIMKSEGK